MKLWSVILVCAMAIASQEVSAKRLGGGASVGKQSSNVSQRSATPDAPGTSPTAPANAAAAKPAAPAAAAPAAAPKRPWGAMLGGLAAGLGLAWLASALGFGEAFAQFLLFALLALVVMAGVGWFMRSRAHGRAASGAGRPAFAYQGADAATPRGYSPQNVGNDASARPWERSTMGFDAGSPALGGGSLIGAAVNGAQNWSIPADFDVEGFLTASKANFVNLQAAWDRSDVPSLRAMMTDEMLEQIKAQLAEREQHTGGVPNKTEVVMLDAHLLGIEELDKGYMASVEFSGLIREDVSTGPNPFREVWNITRPKAGPGGWLVAGVQALQ
ncbi:Tim44 domain-containing protein [Hydrogenophaga sp. OTU3427]|uniref:Tim44 domain-containing protein n=1 Tax=Hydrogenophaga sp. OTU3427 TaxID=3043856 RepID=UPI00313D2A77